MMLKKYNREPWGSSIHHSGTAAVFGGCQMLERNGDVSGQTMDGMVDENPTDGADAETACTSTPAEHVRRQKKGEHNSLVPQSVSDGEGHSSWAQQGVAARKKTMHIMMHDMNLISNAPNDSG
jgi:hypothetical protein